MKKVIIIITSVFLTGCFSVKLLTPVQSDVERVQAKYPGYSLVELNEGKALYEKNCNHCHSIKDPKSKNEKGWNDIVPIMVRKANKKEMKIDPSQQELILKYLVTMSDAPKGNRRSQ